MFTQEIAVEQVAAGGKWLDEHRPGKWWDRVNLDTLRQSSTQDCVLGQVFKDNPTGNQSGYCYAVDAFMADDFETAGGLGFCYRVQEGGPSYYDGYAMLDAAWKDLIVRRRIADGAGQAGVNSMDLVRGWDQMSRGEGQEWERQPDGSWGPVGVGR